MNLDDTGERMLPEKSDATTFWEHVARYRFACQFVKGLDVADIACGEGYGLAAMIRAGARSGVGIDICEETALHAARKYGVKTLVASAEHLPFPDRSLDLIVSFETIEHLQTPEIFLGECQRALRIDGMFLVSTPNAALFEKCRGKSPFHIHGWDTAGFCRLLEAHFEEIKLYGQCLVPVSRVGAFGQRVRLRLCPSLRGERGDDIRHEYRDNAVGAIISGWGTMESLVNPFRVFRMLGRQRSRALFLIAVASRPKVVNQETCVHV